ncbi:helix-turn-helix domain-containing protein [Rhodoferax sp. TS-BS-61-7]|uniref:helix-turn-helix domain-containing protein n=1 Tax=Rhodoferax sp. TS-BS-61-7 TaxID=2094194 RepID=UPI001374C98A|nr:helix-turn-helix transcriptional regulator [Rhodoferax sp. TS-BS-61-7]
MTKFKEAIAKARQSEGYWLSRVKLGVASQLQDHLKAANITQEKYAEKLGVKPPQVSRALSGTNNPTLETLVKMGWALGYVPNVTFVPVQARLAGVGTLADQAELNLDIKHTHAHREVGFHGLDQSVGTRWSGPAVNIQNMKRIKDDSFFLAAA